MGDFGVARDKWVCPNDRELSLRAKLKTGWSVKTCSLRSFGGRCEPLGDGEQEAIVQVIKRAENLDRMEQERVGRLVDRLENMKKNALGNGATQCVLCADEFGLLGASPLICNDCKKAVCTKCGVDTISGHKEPLVLCKICAETRETWKKTGAWFYKGLPKYILPGRKAESAKYNSAPAEQRASWLNKAGKIPSEKENTDSSDDEFKSSRLAKRATTLRKQPPPPTDTTSDNVEPASTMTLESPAQDAGLSPRERNNHWYRPKEPEDSPIKGHARKESQHSPVQRYRPALEDPPAAFQEKTSPPDESSTLEFSLLFDAHNQVLHCTVYRAKGLRPTDLDGLADPFVRLHLLPIQSKMDKLRTRTVHKTLNPEFNEAVSFYGISDYDIAKRTLRMTVMDEDVHCNEPLGEVRIALKRLKPQQPSYANVYLERPRADEVEEERGRVLISLLHSEEHGALVVGVLRCVRLPPRQDSNGFPDPYVKVQIKPDALRRRFKTSIKKKTLNPEYNEQFAFEVEPGDLAKKTIEVTVWDKDSAKADVYMGGLALNMQSKGDRLRHWMDAVRNPNRRVERWHPLSNILFID